MPLVVAATALDCSSEAVGITSEWTTATDASSAIASSAKSVAIIRYESISTIISMPIIPSTDGTAFTATSRARDACKLTGALLPKLLVIVASSPDSSSVATLSSVATATETSVAVTIKLVSAILPQSADATVSESTVIADTTSELLVMTTSESNGGISELTAADVKSTLASISG